MARTLNQASCYWPLSLTVISEPTVTVVFCFRHCQWRGEHVYSIRCRNGKNLLFSRLESWFHRVFRFVVQPKFRHPELHVPLRI